MSLTEAEQSSAAAVAEAILGTAAAQGIENAEAVLGQDAPEASVAAPERVSRPAQAQAPAETPEPEPAPDEQELPSFEPTIPEDLAALLEEPDFDAEAEAEIRAEAEESYIEDPDAAAKLRALEKRNAFLESQLVERSRKNWVAENLRAYPLLREYAKEEVEAFSSTSRRAFAREAAALNTRLEKIAKPMLTDIQTTLAALKGDTTAQARLEAKKAWGDPHADQPAAGKAAEQADRIAAAERTGELKDVFKVMLEDNPLGI